jgi:hypothetical protein
MHAFRAFHQQAEQHDRTIHNTLFLTVFYTATIFEEASDPAFEETAIENHSARGKRPRNKSKLPKKRHARSNKKENPWRRSLEKLRMRHEVKLRIRATFLDNPQGRKNLDSTSKT